MESARLMRKKAVKSPSFREYRERRVANEMGVGEERAEERDGLDLVDFDPIVKRTPAGREKDQSLIDLQSTMPVLNLQQKVVMAGVQMLPFDFRRGPPESCICAATHRYSGQHQDELSLEPGDLVQPVGELERGWWRGRKLHLQPQAVFWRRPVGVFPSNFVICFRLPGTSFH